MTVFLSLGSNLGDRLGHLRAALNALPERGITVRRCSSVYETEPKDLLDQPWFLNIVVEGTTELQPEELWHACLEIERQRSRIREQPRGPRTLDIDIIFYGNHVIQTENLTIPHPRFAERRFVLEPLAEIAPEFVAPVQQKPVKNLLQELIDPSTVRKIAPPPSI